MFRGSERLFENRAEAGRALVGLLSDWYRRDAVVLGLPRGGVAVGYEVCQALELPLEVLVTRKLGAPGQPEYAIGAVAEDGSVEVDERAVAFLGVSPAYLERETAAQLHEAARRVALYRGGRPLPSLAGRTVIVVDDGVATGYTALAGLRAVRALGAERLILAAPVMAPEAARRLESLADEVLNVACPEDFGAVGTFYRDFGQLSDHDVIAFLERARRL